ncbi:MAG: hypothetical protein BJ554DRAFT_7063 [Olpidium bornovanus]|uniref:Uncharacterized protein n=1 Tax=Olpidium bornovanus TaxID=278681 RepID=A0A8H7ZWT9_9FUNG|nr:MAG: hypothetical protein BJ554DRAFT_7063 [Olpidium bornovanus]
MLTPGNGIRREEGSGGDHKRIDHDGQGAHNFSKGGHVFFEDFFDPVLHDFNSVIAILATWVDDLILAGPIQPVFIDLERAAHARFPLTCSGALSSVLGMQQCTSRNVTTRKRCLIILIMLMPIRGVSRLTLQQRPATATPYDAEAGSSLGFRRKEEQSGLPADDPLKGLSTEPLCYSAVEPHDALWLKQMEDIIGVAEPVPLRIDKQGTIYITQDTRQVNKRSKHIENRIRTGRKLVAGSIVRWGRVVDINAYTYARSLAALLAEPGPTALRGRRRTYSRTRDSLSRPFGTVRDGLYIMGETGPARKSNFGGYGEFPPPPPVCGTKHLGVSERASERLEPKEIKADECTMEGGDGGRRAAETALRGSERCRVSTSFWFVL